MHQTKIQNMKAIQVLTLTLALAALPLWAASSQEQLAASIRESQTETVRTRDQLQMTVNALTALTEQNKGDLRANFNAFSMEVKNTHGAAAWTAARAQSMQATSKSYFDGWQADVTSISNESLRKQAQKRLDKVRKSYDKSILSLKEAGEKFKPFLSNLDDVQKTLANDVTAGGVKAIRGTAGDAKFNLKKVRSSVADALEELENMQRALSPEAAR